MKDFKKGGSSSFRGGNGGKSFGGGSRGGDRSGGSRDRFNNNDREMHTATCSECGKRCEVPFRPTGEKPVYCNDCFGSKREGSFERNDRPMRDFGSKPSFRNDRDSSPRPDNSSKSNDELKRQIDVISSKLDALIKMVQSGSNTTSVPVKAESLKSMVEKTQKPAKVVKPTVAKKATPAKKKVEKKAAPAKKAPAAKAKKPAPKKK